MMTLTLVAGFFGFFGSLGFIATRGLGSPAAFLWTQVSIYQGAWLVPGWALVPAAGVFVSGLALLVACRKLYDIEARALNYTQFSAVWAIVGAAALARNWGRPTEEGCAAWLLLGFAMILVGSLIFCVHRMAVGDDVWRLKRAVVPLRRLDEPVVFLAALGALWLWVGWRFAHSGKAPIEDGVLLFLGAVVAAPAVLWAILVRLAGLTEWRNPATARRIALVAGLVVWLVLPALAFAFAHAGSRRPDSILMATSRLSPVFSVWQVLDLKGRATAGWSDLPGSALTAAYGILALAALAAYLPASFRHIRGQRIAWNGDGHERARPDTN